MSGVVFALNNLDINAFIAFVLAGIDIFRRGNIPVRIAHKSFTLRQALSHTSTERKCTRDKCPISNTGLCLRRNAVYQLTCNICDQQYIGSTTRFIYDRVRVHINNENSSVKKHIYSCLNKGCKGIDVKIIMSENDPANLRFYEALYIRKCKPTLNSNLRSGPVLAVLIHSVFVSPCPPECYYKAKQKLSLISG